MSERLIVAALLLSFALWVTSHVTIAVGLVRRPPRWRCLVGLLVPPLALYWAVRERMRIRAFVWTSSLVIYACALILASR